MSRSWFSVPADVVREANKAYEEVYVNSMDATISITVGRQTQRGCLDYREEWSFCFDREVGALIRFACVSSVLVT